MVSVFKSLIILVFFLASPTVLAQVKSCTNSSDMCTLDEASLFLQANKPSSSPACSVQLVNLRMHFNVQMRLLRWEGQCAGQNHDGYHFPPAPTAYYFYACESPTVWNPISNKCDRPCKERGPLGAGTVMTSHIFGEPVCHAGCQYVPDHRSSGLFINIQAGSEEKKTRISTKGFIPSGALCGQPAQPDQVEPSHPPEDCIQHESMSFCTNGEQLCATASSGRRFCWNPHETGSKTDGPNLQERTPGPNQPEQPQKSPPPGEQYIHNSSTTITTTTNNNSSITNISNYNTQHGTDASGPGGKDSGESAGSEGQRGDGSGSGDGKDDGDGDGYGTVGGDGRCSGSFTCSGGDPVLCAIAQQTYAARCEADARFSGDIGDFPEGDNEGDADAMDNATKTANIGPWLLDRGGFFGGGSCPTLPTATTSWGPFSFEDVDFCGLINVARTCILLLAAFMSIGILMGWKS